MAIQETDMREFLLRRELSVQEVADKVIARSLERIDTDPSAVVQDLLSARDAYIGLIANEAPTTLAFSPLRAAASYLEFKCRNNFEAASYKNYGKTGEFLSFFAEGIGEIAWALVTAEDAVAIGAKTQTQREVEDFVKSVPEDDRADHRRTYGKFAEMKVKRRLKRLMRDSSGRGVAQGELEDLKMLRDGNSPYPVSPPFEQVWNEINVKGAEYATQVYSKVLVIATPLFRGNVINAAGLRIIRPGK
jgi:hypothetical protein